ncbi:MAG: 30S ribosomal protein S12 methylthiotransferase RimO [Deltaproteobacteria bacterium]|jgi:ribosomal protein S12 methylthiotransferase|nr:30S ribosomal protein S12 methylthiotransferase RimO [Deltaproteobacteria bacterium]
MGHTIYIETLGCAKNRVDSEIMLGTLLNSGFTYEPDSEKAAVIIVNTCGFLTSAVNESINRILSLAENKKTGNCLKLVVAGCMSERYRDSLLDEISEIDGIIGTSDYTEILTCINNLLENNERSNLLHQRPIYSHNNAKAIRALSTKQHYTYLKIAEGCSNMCSFCNIPKLRGKYISREPESICKEFLDLVSRGIKEISLISQDSSSYGRDLTHRESLGDLVRKLLESIQEDFWLRLFYLYPNRFPIELIDIMNQDQRLVPYIDIPLQHINSDVLKTMNRKIDRDQIQELLDKILNKNESIAIRTTFIVGYPTETEKHFRELLDFVEKGYFQHAGVFEYSFEDNIAAVKYGDPISDAIKKERREVLLAAQQEVSAKKNQSQVGQIQKVLVEGLSDDTDLLLQGRNKYQGIEVDGVVLINDGQADSGDFVKVEITEAHPYDLIGKII